MAESTTDHRPAWLPLAASAIVVPTALAGLTLLWPRPQIESGLTTAATSALAAAGFPSAGITFDGRDATISGIPTADSRDALDAVEAVSGVRVATATEAGSGGATETPAFGVARRGEDIVLTGQAQSDSERSELVAAATARAGGRKVVDELTVIAGDPLQPGVDARSIGTIAAAVAGGSSDVAVAIGADGATLTGTAADDATKAAIAQKVTAALAGVTVDDKLTVSAPPTGTAPPTGGATGDLDAAAKQRLQSSIAALVAGAPIAFEPDSPRLTAAGLGTVAKVLALVTAAPGARLQVDGYVAAGPGDGKLTAQQLSDQRAATVRDALVAGGVPADRVVATGKGEDSAAASRALGRRVAITVV